jgi:hypothetical protein
MLRSQTGIALMTILAFMSVISVLAATYTLTIRADTALRGGVVRERASFYAAEAGLNNAMAEVREFFANQTPPGAAYTDSLVLDTGAYQRTVEYQIAPVPGKNPAPPSLIPIGQPFAGLYTIPSEYTITSVAKNSIGDQETRLGAQFAINSVPIFQFMAFSENTLDVQNAPPMVVSGRIHTNGDLYLNTWSTLTIGDRRSPPNLPPDNPFVQISAAGDIYRGGLANDCMGTITVDKQEDAVAPTPDLDPLDLPCSGTGPAVVDAATRVTFLGSLQAGVDRLQVPGVFTLTRGESGVSGGLFWERADLRIVLNNTASRVTNFCGLNIPNPGLYAIEVQNADGSRNTVKTNALWQFMCERRGAIFYNDIPTASPALGYGTPMVGGPDPAAASDPSNPQNYSPEFAQGDPAPTRAARVYRRVGEDTNGDGTVDTNGDGTVTNSDTNYDVCPVEVGAGPIGPRPMWRPDSCNSKFGAWSGTGNNNIKPDQQQVANFLPSSWFADADYRRGGFYNWREAAWVMMLNVNIRAVIDWNEANGTPLFPANDTSDGGLVFFLSVQANDSTTTPPPTGVRYGVRVFDSANLNTRGSTFPRPNPADPTGLTVVSDVAMHVQGNYNYYPAMTLATKLPAAVMGDTINILSQSWEVPAIVDVTLPIEKQWNNDRKTPQARVPARLISLVDGYFSQNSGLLCASGPCTSFTPTNTFGINAALLTNTVLSVPGTYGGGLENFPRFFESWEPGGTARSLTYAGSFVSLGTPRFETGPFRGRGSIVYDPPQRNWDYDASFNDVKLLPPITPMVNLIQQRMFTRFYQ